MTKIETYVDQWGYMRHIFSEPFGPKEQQMTNYVILKQFPDDHTPSLWEQITAMNAHNPRAAIRKVIEGTGAEGTYIAVPARSWKQETVDIETKNAIKFS